MRRFLLNVSYKLTEYSLCIIIKALFVFGVCCSGNRWISALNERMIILTKINKFKASVIQAGSRVMDKERCVKKTIRLIAEAGGNDAKVIAFTEVFIPA